MKTAVYEEAERKKNLTLADDERSANQNQLHMNRQSEWECYEQVILFCFDL